MEFHEDSGRHCKTTLDLNKVYMVLLVIEIWIAFTFVLVHTIKPLYLIWVWCSYACLGGHFSIFPTLWAQIYGPLNGGKVYSLLFTGFATATLLNWFLSKQSGKSISYDVLFYILASLAVIAFVLAIFLNTTPKVGVINRKSGSVNLSRDS